MKRLLAFWRGEEGPTAVEYAIMLALIVGVCFASISAMTQATADSFNGSGEKIGDAVAGAGN